MADKFPEINDVAVDNAAATESDFLSREKEALGDEFTTDGDADILKQANGEANDEDDEFDDFKSQFPEVGSPADDAVVQQEEYAEEPTSPIVNKFSNLNLDESEHIKEWKAARDLEISKRDEIAERKLRDIKAEAEKAIDDFYDNYNNKKDDAIAETRKEAEKFMEKRDTFLDNGTVWDRVIDLLNLDQNSDAIDAANFRDKTKFRDLLLALKGKESVPGAQ